MHIYGITVATAAVADNASFSHCCICCLCYCCCCGLPCCDCFVIATKSETVMKAMIVYCYNKCFRGTNTSTSTSATAPAPAPRPCPCPRQCHRCYRRRHHCCWLHEDDQYERSHSSTPVCVVFADSHCMPTQQVPVGSLIPMHTVQLKDLVNILFASHHFVQFQPCWPALLGYTI